MNIIIEHSGWLLADTGWQLTHISYTSQAHPKPRLGSVWDALDMIGSHKAG
ncbi:MAG TPA: hypothetical protein PLO57_03220 [Candidatus Cloacimonadota bacterium]|nr:hypothetical protein [Candidatus Cloacimonadota bacterium]